jgi:hypothetical protein
MILPIATGDGFMLLGKIKTKIEKIIDSRIENRIFSDSFLQILSQMQEFKTAPADMLASNIEAKTNISDCVTRFNNLGVDVEDVCINVKDFESWLTKYPEIFDHYINHSDVRIEKCLEHYLSMKHLGINEKDVFVDIAASGSPFANIISKKLKIDAYMQDLIYEEGIHGNKIGSDAGSIPVSDKFASVLALHCAFECFQGDSDIRFIKEAGRVLCDGGRLGILPLYIDDDYFVKSGPKYDKNKVSIEEGVKWIWRDDDYAHEPFSRHYSPEAFKERILDNMENLNGKILHFTNLKDLELYYPKQRIYCNFMFVAIR